MKSVIKIRVLSGFKHRVSAIINLFYIYDCTHRDRWYIHTYGKLNNSEGHFCNPCNVGSLLTNEEKTTNVVQPTNVENTMVSNEEILKKKWTTRK